MIIMIDFSHRIRKIDWKSWYTCLAVFLRALTSPYNISLGSFLGSGQISYINKCNCLADCYDWFHFSKVIWRAKSKFDIKNTLESTKNGKISIFSIFWPHFYEYVQNFGLYVGATLFLRLNSESAPQKTWIMAINRDVQSNFVKKNHKRVEYQVKKNGIFIEKMKK